MRTFTNTSAAAVAFGGYDFGGKTFSYLHLRRKDKFRRRCRRTGPWRYTTVGPDKLQLVQFAMCPSAEYVKRAAVAEPWATLAGISCP